MSNPNINNKLLRAKNAELLDDIKTLLTPPLEDEKSKYQEHFHSIVIKYMNYFNKRNGNK